MISGEAVDVPPTCSHLGSVFCGKARLKGSAPPVLPAVLPTEASALLCSAPQGSLQAGSQGRPARVRTASTNSA